MDIGVELQGRELQRMEGDTVRMLSPSETVESSRRASQSLSFCLPLPALSVGRRTPMAVGPDSECWVDGENLTNCPDCDVEFGVQHKHVTRRHCRKCGGVFCYTCTYDKAMLRTGIGCLPFFGPEKSLHVCTSCYESCPPPADGLRRCRFCHQRVRISFFAAHHSVCLEEQYSRARFAPLQLQHFVGGASNPPPGDSTISAALATSSSPDGSSSLATPAEEALVSTGDHDASVTQPAKKKHPFTVAKAASESAKALVPDALECSICMTGEANAAIVPCGHAVACVRCLERCDQSCPVCRKPIQSILRIYRS